jgi:hypothetical protein
MKDDFSNKITPQALWTCIAYLQGEAASAGYPMTARFLETTGKILIDEVPTLKGLMMPEEPSEDIKSSVLGLDAEMELARC